MTLSEFREDGSLEELARIYNQDLAVRALLQAAGVPLESVPPFGHAAALHFWAEVGRLIDGGLPPGRLDLLLHAAAREYPENRRLRPFLALKGPRQERLRQIRAAVPDFVGRQEDLKALLESFERGATISGVSGQGGVGKTELALKLAEAVGERFPDGHLYLDLRGFDPDRPPLPRREVLAHVIRSFCPQEKLPDDDGALEGLYHGVLAGKRVLLLLDNAHGPEQLKRLLPPPGCGLLVTSRRRFTLPGLPEPLDLDALPLPDAVQLLREAARLTEAEAEDIVGLCGRLPQALRLAGSLLAERDDLAVSRYQERLRAARFAERSGLSEVAVAIRLSEETLPEPLWTRWRELALLAGGFELAWAAAVWDVDEETAEDRVAALRKISLLRWDADTRFYRLHDLVREYAAERLTGAEREAAARRHAEFFCQVLCDAHELYLKGGAAITEALRRFDRAWPDAQASFTWMATRLKDDAACARLCVRLVLGCASMYELRQHARARIPWLETAAMAARAVGDRRNEVRVLCNLGTAYAHLGQPQRAIEFYQQDLAIAREIGDRQGEGQTLNNLGLAYAALGQTQRAIESYQQGLAIARAVGDRRDAGQTLGNLGIAYNNLGQPQRAIKCYEERLAIARELGDRRGEGLTLSNLGVVYADLGQPQRAIECYEQDLAITREVGDRRGEGTVLGRLGNVYSDLGQSQQAIKCYEQHLGIAREVGDRRGEGAALGNLANVYVETGQPQRAIDFYQQQLTIIREVGDRRAEGRTLGNLGAASAALGQPQRAVEFYQQTLTIMREAGDRQGEAICSWNLGNYLATLGRLREGVPLLEVYVAFLYEIRHPNAEHCAAHVKQLRRRLKE
jgi:tetratricopeptide (TPR) repeat protein